MIAYSVFDDFPKSASELLEKNNIKVILHPKGKERPCGNELKKLIDEYDIIIISTAQKITENMLKNTPPCKKIIATASIGTDHISIPDDKKNIIKVVNAPNANKISVAEHIFGLIIALKKQFIDGKITAALGKNKKEMRYKPHDLYGLTIGIIGAGGTAGAVLKMAKAFGMERISWTRNPEKHTDLSDDGVVFTELDELIKSSDIISLNLPYTPETEGIISASRINNMKNNAVFISVSRSELTDNAHLFKKARDNDCFCIGMDVDADKVFGMWNENMKNVIVTPHIAGGTVEARIRMFNEVSTNILLQNW